MMNLWSNCDDEFFNGLFTYLKRKFSIKTSTFAPMQNITVRSIYHESIVALEDVHNVLRRIENDSAPTREDYKNAVERNDENKKQEIITFFRKLALLDEGVFDAFRSFTQFYYFDAIINRYAVFLENERSNSISFDAFFKQAKTWEPSSFDEEQVFKFIESYKISLLDQQTNQVVLESLAEQHDLYETVMMNYDELVDRNINIGVSVVDIILPSSLKDYETRPDYLSTELLTRVIQRLESTLERDESILLTINHAHVISNNHFVLSYLLIYKANIHKSSKLVAGLIEDKVVSIIGTLHMQKVQVISREAMLKTLYPQDAFTGTLVSSKQKTAFREKFLRYFISSIFLMKLDENSELKHQKAIKNISLNGSIFYKEKLFLPPEPKVKAVKKKFKDKPQKPMLSHLNELIDESDFDKSDKYFNHRGLPSEESKQIRLMIFLYKQQGITTISDSLIDDLIRIESFLSRLMYDSIFEFADDSNWRSYEASPKWGKLSVLFQQFLLVSEMKCIHGESRIPTELATKATSFIEEYDAYFDCKYDINRVSLLKIDLLDYKNAILRSEVEQQQQQLNKNSKKVDSIQDYLNQVFEKDVVILRFLFKCSIRNLEQAHLFDGMFRDYVENLKRRHTQGFRLEGHVGVYIPHQGKHYIDAVLFFKIGKNRHQDLNVLKHTVIDYWENYVEKKQEQINNFNRKHPYRHPKYLFVYPYTLVKFDEADLKTMKWQGLNFCKNILNPFVDFKRKKLRAECLPVVQTENSLNHDCLEVFQGQKARQKLLIEKLSVYYAHCPVILVRPDDSQLFPRKNHLILGRFRSSPKKNSEPVSSFPED